MKLGGHMPPVTPPVPTPMPDSYNLVTGMNFILKEGNGSIIYTHHRILLLLE